MKYIIKSEWIRHHMADEYFKQALLEEVQLYVDTYYTQYGVRVYGEWQEIKDSSSETYENEKIKSWVLDLLSVF